MPTTLMTVPAFDRNASKRTLAGLSIGLGIVGVCVLDTQLAVVLIVAPLLEEIVFRRGMQQALHDHLGDRVGATWVAVVLTAVAFALAHLLLRPAPWAAWTLLPALGLGAIYQATRRVGPCVVLHALFNLIWLVAAPRLALP